MSSPDWALAAPGTVSAQEFSYWNARQSLFAALTEPTEVARKAAFGRTFETLGHVVHHLQDMAQPQHVRNDPHCNWFPCGLVGSGPSRYETFTKSLGSNLPTDPPIYDIVSPTFTSTFNSPRRLWHTETGQNSPAAGKGIAEFTNRNFVSYGTNFDRPGLFPSPVPNKIDPNVDIQALCQNAAWCSSLHGTMTFYGNTVKDKFLGSDADTDNPRASTFSTFDQDLINRGGTPKFSLNRFNFQAAHSFLIPRAVAYSAGMINYFFRGKIDLVPDDTNPGTFLIKNLGSESMTGDFALYYDSDAGAVNNRTLFVDFGTISIAANDKQNIGAIPPDPINPAPKNPGEYMLVFKGNMGAETTADFGAVVGKSITLHKWTIVELPPAGSVFNFGSVARAINNNGQVVGYFTDGNDFAFGRGAELWSSSGVRQDIVSSDPNFPSKSALGINDLGQVVGRTFGPSGPATFLWSSQSGFQIFLDFNAVTMIGINNSGQVVGTYLGNSERAFIWSSASGMQDLGILQQNVPFAQAFGVNNNGQVVGVSGISPDPQTVMYRAFLWSGGIQDLGTLPGWSNSAAYGINGSGQVVGTSFNTGAPGSAAFGDDLFVGSISDGHAFLWSGGMQDLGTLPGQVQSAAYGINKNGQVVDESGGHAFLWSSRSGIQDLGLIPEVVAAGWSALSSARAINNVGQIAGWGIRNGQLRGFLLTPSRRSLP